MRIIQCKSTLEANQTVAGILLEKVISHPNSVLGLATGQTMIPIYALLKELAESSGASFQKAFFFMLDEYLGFPESHPSTFKYYITSNFLIPMGLNESQFAFPPAHLKDGPAQYEKNIKESGGIDLQLLGVGRNGHVGFNEPGSLKNSRTRIIKLTDETLTANRLQFLDEIIPSEAFSMGIETIMESRELLMLATGSSKAEVIKYLLNHHDDSNCPLTYFKEHPHFTLVLDPEAASKINLNI